MTTLLAVRLKRLLSRRGFIPCEVCQVMVSPATVDLHRLAAHPARVVGVLPYPSIRVGREVA